MLDVIAYVAFVVLLTVPLAGCWAYARRPTRARADRQLLHLARTADRKARR